LRLQAVFEIGGNDGRVDLLELVYPPGVAPPKELTDAAAVGPAGVRVADVGGEEFDEAPRGAIAGASDERRTLSCVGDRATHLAALARITTVGPEGDVLACTRRR
jgi:hypothetical protein